MIDSVRSQGAPVRVPSTERGADYGSAFRAGAGHKRKANRDGDRRHTAASPESI